MRAALVAVFVLAVAAALRIGFFSGMVLFDDAHYAARAWELAQGHFTLPKNVFDARLGLVGPAALFYAAFGAGKVTTGMFPFLCSLGSVASAFFLGRRLWGERVAFYAAAFVAVFPMDVLYAGALFATAPETFFVGTSLGLYLLAERERRPALYVACGLCLGAAALVHETALIALVFYPAYALVVARPSRRQLWVVAGLALPLALDPLVHGLMGDAGARLGVLAGGTVAHGTSGETDFRGFNLHWLSEPFFRLATEQELGLFPWVLAPLALWRLRKPAPGARDDAHERTLALYLVVVAFWLLYGSVSPARYAPLGRLPRYLAALVLPGAWLLAHELCARRSPRARAVVTAGLALSSLACALCDGGRARIVPYEGMRDAIARSGAARVHVEPKQAFPLGFVEGFHPRYALLPLEPAIAPPPGAYAVVASAEGRAHLEALPGAELVASSPAPDTIYTKVLRTRAALAVLRLTRPDYRVRDLEAKTRPWALELYRLRPRSAAARRERRTSCARADR